MLVYPLKTALSVILFGLGQKMVSQGPAPMHPWYRRPCIRPISYSHWGTHTQNKIATRLSDESDLPTVNQ